MSEKHPTSEADALLLNARSVRSLARDFGRELNLPAHMGRLVRTRIGTFGIEDGFPSGWLSGGEAEGLRGIALSEAMAFLPGIVIGENSKRALFDGVLPGEGDVLETVGSITGSTPLRILDESGELLAIGSHHGETENRRDKLVYSYRLFVDRESSSR